MALPVQYTSKIRILSDDSLVFCDKPLPLRRVYFLGDGACSEISIAPMRACDALIGLVQHSFLLDIEARDMIEAHFDALAALVAQPLYFRLDYPRSYGDLPKVRQAILLHASMDDGTP